MIHHGSWAERPHAQSSRTHQTQRLERIWISTSAPGRDSSALCRKEGHSVGREGPTPRNGTQAPRTGRREPKPEAAGRAAPPGRRGHRGAGRGATDRVIVVAMGAVDLKRISWVPLGRLTPRTKNIRGQEQAWDVIPAGHRDNTCGIRFVIVQVGTLVIPTTNAASASRASSTNRPIVGGSCFDAAAGRLRVHRPQRRSPPHR